MSDGAREDAHRSGRGDDAALRSMSGSAPCGRKESGDDSRRTGRGGRCDRRRRRRGAGVVESADQAKKQAITGPCGLHVDHMAEGQVVEIYCKTLGHVLLIRVC